MYFGLDMLFFGVYCAESDAMRLLPSRDNNNNTTSRRAAGALARKLNIVSRNPIATVTDAHPQKLLFYFILKVTLSEDIAAIESLIGKILRRPHRVHV